MKLEDLLGVAIFGSYALMLTLEALFPARPYPARKLWRVQGFLFLVAMAVIATFTPLMLPGAWLAEHRLIDRLRAHHPALRLAARHHHARRHHQSHRHRQRLRRDAQPSAQPKERPG